MYHRLAPCMCWERQTEQREYFKRPREDSGLTLISKIPHPSSKFYRHHYLLLTHLSTHSHDSTALATSNSASTMMQLSSLAQALGLLAIAPFTSGRPATLSHSTVDPHGALARDFPTELRPGWPWDTANKDLIDSGSLESPSTLAANASCQQDLPLGAGPVPLPDTAATFSAYTPFSASAIANGVDGSSYKVVTVNSNGAAIPTSSDTTPINYLGWVNMASYSADSCAALCTAYGTGSTCHSFNIYYLRSPTVAPSFDSSCPDPSSM